jgi:hypothetical protein
MWAIHVIGLPKSGKSIIAKGLYDRLRPFLATLGINVNLVEMDNLVKEWQTPLQKSANGSVDLNYTDFESPELKALLLSNIDQKGVNIIVGAKERYLLDVSSGDYHPLSFVVGVRAFSGMRLGRAGVANLDAFMAAEKGYAAFPFTGTFDSQCSYVVQNEDGDANDKVTALLIHILSIASSAGLRQ